LAALGGRENFQEGQRSGAAGDDRSIPSPCRGSAEAVPARPATCRWPSDERDAEPAVALGDDVEVFLDGGEQRRPRAAAEHKGDAARASAFEQRPLVEEVPVAVQPNEEPGERAGEQAPRQRDRDAHDGR
jgi:hypothetical protein